MQTEKKIIHTLIILIISLLMAVYVINTIGHTGRIRALDALVDEVIMDTASGDLDAAQKKAAGIVLENDDSTADKRRYESVRKNLIRIIENSR